jgi:hypothetical protein
MIALKNTALVFLGFDLAAASQVSDFNSLITISIKRLFASSGMVATFIAPSVGPFASHHCFLHPFREQSK